MPDDFIYINDLELSARVGTTIEERAFPQRISASIEIHLPLADAGRTDDLYKTIDYALLIEEIRAAVSGREYALVEAVASVIIDVVIAKPRINSVRARVEKNVFPGIRAVGASLWRSRSDKDVR